MVQQQVEYSKHLRGAGVLHPPFAEDGANSRILRCLQQLGGGRGQM